jgi:hypothetical protein
MKPSAYRNLVRNAEKARAAKAAKVAKMTPEQRRELMRAAHEVRRKAFALLKQMEAEKRTAPE